MVNLVYVQVIVNDIIQLYSLLNYDIEFDFLGDCFFFCLDYIKKCVWVKYVIFVIFVESIFDDGVYVELWFFRILDFFCWFCFGICYVDVISC